MRAPLVLAVVVLAALVSAGCLREYEDPHRLQVANVDLAPARVLAREVVMDVNVTLDNRGGGETGPVRLVAKAYDEGTGFLVAQDERDVGALPGDTTREIPLAVRVPREGSVRVEVTVFEDGQGKQSASVVARNLGALEPQVLDTGLRVSDVDFVVQAVEPGGGGNESARVRVQADLYLTNEGSEPSEGLRIQVKAREVTTRLVADVAWLDSGGVAPGTTAIRSVNLSVPDGYNYAFEILTWRGDVVVARNEGTVQLAPTFEKPKDQEIVTTDTDVRDFLRRPATPGAPGSPEYGAGNRAGGATPEVPGPALPLVALALGAAAIVIGRRRR